MDRKNEKHERSSLPKVHDEVQEYTAMLEDFFFAEGVDKALSLSTEEMLADGVRQTHQESPKPERLRLDGREVAACDSCTVLHVHAKENAGAWRRGGGDE